MKLQFLGTGNAAGVPVHGCSCSACYKARVATDYRRFTACAKLEMANDSLFLDAGLANLCERFPNGQVKNILLSHFHPDHLLSLFQLRWGVGEPIDVFAPQDQEGCADLYRNPGILRFKSLKPFTELSIANARVTPVPLNHSVPTFGYCIEHGYSRLAYLTDTCGVPESTQQFLQTWKPSVLVLDATHPPMAETPHNHNDLVRALGVVESVQPERALLTHISHELDLWFSRNPDYQLPDQVELAYDGYSLIL